MMNITLDKHETVVDKDFVEAVFEIAFGEDAIDKDYSYDDVINRLKEVSDASKF
jgi:hypothetical protein